MISLPGELERGELEPIPEEEILAMTDDLVKHSKQRIDLACAAIREIPAHVQNSAMMNAILQAKITKAQVGVLYILFRFLIFSWCFKEEEEVIIIILSDSFISVSPPRKCTKTRRSQRLVQEQQEERRGQRWLWQARQTVLETSGPMQR